MNTENNPQVIIVKSEKNVGLGVILAVLFGPLGLLYSTVKGGLIMMLVNLLVGIFTFGFGLFFSWPICGIWAYVASKKYNETLLSRK